MRSFARRLTLQTVLAIVGISTFVALVVAVLALSAGVAARNERAQDVVQRAVAVLDAAAIASGDADGAVRALAPTVGDPSLHLWVTNATERVVAVRTGGTLVVRHLPRSESEFDATPLGSRVVKAFATAAGVRTFRVETHGLSVFVGTDERRFEETFLRGALALAVAIVVIVAIAYAAARRLTAHVMRPLTAVVEALERFASGDLTPQPVDTAGDEDLARLAHANNAVMRRVERALTERDRAEAQMRRFFADAAHQLRTPLTVVQGFVTMLERGTLSSDGERANALRLVGEQTRTMAELTANLIRLEHWESPTVDTERRPVRIDELVRDTVLPFVATHPERQVTLDATTRARVLCTPRELEDAFANVVDNAFKYTGGAPIAIRVRETDDHVVVTIADRGPGVGDTDPARLFERFHRGERRDVPGSGLGLAIAQRAVVRAGGTIELASDVHGTTVTIALPLTDG